MTCEIVLAVILLGATSIILGLWAAIDPKPNKIRLRAIEIVLIITTLWLLHGFNQLVIDRQP